MLPAESQGGRAIPEPGAVDTADFEVLYTTNDESTRPIAQTLIRATGGTPQFGGSLENAREY